MEEKNVISFARLTLYHKMESPKYRKHGISCYCGSMDGAMRLAAKKIREDEKRELYAIQAEDLELRPENPGKPEGCLIMGCKRLKYAYEHEFPEILAKYGKED